MIPPDEIDVRDAVSHADPEDPSTIEFQTADAGMCGPVIGPMVVPGTGATTDASELSIQPFESEANVRKWAHTAAQYCPTVEENESIEPVVAIEQLADGWIAVVYVVRL